VVDPLDLKNEPLEHLRYERHGHVAVVTLDRPDRGNSVTARMHAGLRAIWQDVGADPEIRVAVVTGAGERHFCTGADVEALAERGTVAAGSGALAEELFYTARHNRVWKPVICAVNGLVAAAGLHFVVDADIVVASRSAAFTDTHVNVGMIGAIENIGLLLRLPLGAALRMTLVGRDYRMPAERAYELGLADELAEPERLMELAMGLAQSIAANSPTAVSLSQQAIWGSLELPYEEALERAWDMVKAHRGHPDAAEGPRAFVEKRSPRWAPPSGWTSDRRDTDAGDGS
jgi:enoyl-CoA hydratase/carnithine racemase